MGAAILDIVHDTVSAKVRNKMETTKKQPCVFSMFTMEKTYFVHLFGNKV